MSKKSKIFTYGTGKRKIGHSKFDMSFTNTYSQGFGALNPVACYETLPDDFWNIGTDGVTLLKPLAAPAFSDIKQHYYAFSVRNSAIWDHWNDFITNGTAFSDVYGSNASNQSAGNPWVVPQINAGYLQDICKIGSGYGVPFEVIDSDDLNQILEDLFTDCGVSFTFTDSTVRDVTNFFMYLIEMPQFLNYPQGALIRDMMRDSLICAQALYDSTLSGTYKYKFRLYVAGCHAFTSKLWNLLVGSSYSVASASTSSTIGYDSFQSTQSDNDVAASGVKFLMFMNDAISRCKLSESPFFFEPMSYSYANSIAGQVYSVENVYKSYRYVRRYSEVPVSLRHDVSPGVNYLYTCRSVNSTFTGRYYAFNATVARDPDDLWRITLDSRIVDPSIDLGGFEESIQTICNGIAPYFGVVLHLDEYICSPYGYLNTDSSGFLAASFSMPTPYFNSFNSPFSSESPYNSARSLGFDADSFSVYLCQNSLRLLDGYNVPVSGLSCRSYFYYRYQDFNALPFFANCKIWDEFFRNTVVSSPELDYSKSNGQILFDNALRSFQANTTFPTQERLPEKYSDLANPVGSWPLNSWVIPFESIPLNGMLNEGISLPSSGGGGAVLVVSLSGHHNQLVIRNRVDVFRLLTGFCLDFMVLDKMYHLFVAQSANNSVSYRTFSELFTKNFYLPNYYNGLLHLKYQNFNKDYFTSAMLDPMSGANQVAIGSTVTENRLAETKQSWFERIAQQRSVKGFIEAIWGTTPTLDEKMPKFLGSEHVPVNIGEVIQTSASTATSPQGQRVGIGGSRGGSALVHGHVNEHGWLIVLSSFTVESQYCQGLEKQLIPVDSYMDYPTIDFAHVGNESIIMKELNFDGQPYIPFNQEGFGTNEQGPAFTFYNRKGLVMYGYGNPRRVVSSSSSASTFPTLAIPYTQDLSTVFGYFLSRRNVARATGTSLDHVFGYIPRYSSYKFKLDQVHGEFRDELEFWHTFRFFYGMPILSHEFVNWELCADDNEFNRIFAVTTDSDNKFLCETHFTASVDRALPYVCVPQSK